MKFAFVAGLSSRRLIALLVDDVAVLRYTSRIVSVVEDWEEEGAWGKHARTFSHTQRTQ